MYLCIEFKRRIMEQTENWTDKAIENIIDAIDKIRFDRVTILTGENGSGKSLIRKLIPYQLKEKNGGELVKVASTSMDRRTGLHSEMGGAGVFCRDNEWVATSSNSLGFIKGLLNSTKDRFVVIDEPEIGMSDTLKISVGNWLNKNLPELLDRNKAVMIITHSKDLVKEITFDHDFINIQGLTEEEWMNEKPKLIDLDEWEERNDELFKALQKRLKNHARD